MNINSITAFAGCLLLLFSAISVQAQDDAEPSETEEELQFPGTLPFEEQVPVAEEGLEEEFTDEMVGPGLFTTEPPPSDEEMLQTEFEHFKQLFDDGLLDEADSVAKRVIELAIATKGPRSNEMAKALTNLAIVQHRSRQYEAAQQNYESAIEIIEENEDRLNEQLVNPLRGLAAAQLESGRPDLASTTYDRAVHVTHVNKGPHNLDQIDLLEDLAEVKLRMGEADTAKDVQDRIYALNIRAHDIDSLEIVPPLMRRAAWQHRAGFIYDERSTYRRVIRIIEDKEDKDSLKLIDPLILLGRSFFFLDMSGEPRSYQAASGLSSGEIYFKRALRIAEENPDSDWQILTKSILNLADFFMFEGNYRSAGPVYLDAWNLLSDPEGDPEKLQLRREQLESVVMLRQRPIPEYVGETNPTLRPPQTDDPVMQGRVSVSYDISARGRAANLKLIEAEPPEFVSMQHAVQRELRSRIFRPIHVDGEPAESRNNLFVHTFYYRKSDLETARESETSTDLSDTELTELPDDETG